MANRSSSKTPSQPSQKVVVRRIDERGTEVLTGPLVGNEELRSSLQPARDAAERGMAEVRRILATTR